ncbi:unnamed protein product [Dracunculus medinensis]|uniref:Acyl_transf_3 domain-containing protein n=1 Tax=Dracunculus medinensis TaxID=318479 RepID=A0A0N4UG39_DRAME|nr:unnamed protein product [Dracunculus medinensis]
MKNERNSSNILLFIGVFGARCDQTDWILHFFFISNFFPNECMPWMWYLSLDMQLHLIAPFLISVILKWRTIGRNINIAIAVASILYRLVILIIYRHFKIFSRALWATGLAIFIWLLENNYWKFAYKLLGNEKWLSLSRVSYGLYLAHEPLILYFVWTRREAIKARSLFYLIVFGLEMYILSTIIAIILAIVIEVHFCFH